MFFSSFVFFVLLIFTLFLFRRASNGGRSTSQNGTNTNAGVVDPREHGEALGRALAGTGEASSADGTCRALTTMTGLAALGDRELPLAARGPTTVGRHP
jgi:hypothetical protein